MIVGLIIVLLFVVTLLQVLGQPTDHPESLTIPETGYIKGALLEVMD